MLQKAKYFRLDMGGSLNAQWERYLYEKHRLVALGPWEHMKPFTVLLKKQDKDKKKLALVKVGSVDSLRVPVDDSDDEVEWQDIVENTETENGSVMETLPLPNIECSTDRESKIWLKFLHFFGAATGASKGLHLKVSNVTTERVLDEVAAKLFSDNNPLWVPDLEIIRGKYEGNLDGTIEMWIVTEVNYCEEILLASNYGAFLSLSVTTDALAPGTSLSAKVEVTGDNKNKIRISGQKVPVGFKAIRLVYDKQGHMRSFMEMGKVQPDVERGSELNPDDNPWYHMGGLFRGLEEDNDMECIEIISED